MNGPLISWCYGPSLFGAAGFDRRGRVVVAFVGEGRQFWRRCKRENARLAGLSAEVVLPEVQGEIADLGKLLLSQMMDCDGMGASPSDAVVQ